MRLATCLAGLVNLVNTIGTGVTPVAINEHTTV